MSKLLRLNLFFVLAFLLVFAASPAAAATPNGVDLLRGRWDGTLVGFEEDPVPFTILFDQSAPDAYNPETYLYGGCMAVGSGKIFAPILAKVTLIDAEHLGLLLYGNAFGSVIILTGDVWVYAASVTDDSAEGMWKNDAQEDAWSAVHRDRRNPDCPPIPGDQDYFFTGDVYGLIGMDPSGEHNLGTLLEGWGNIVATAMQIELPDGSIVVAPFDAGIFNPDIDFVDSFRFFAYLQGLPTSAAPYTFTLLDVLGRPIAGTTRTDMWTACTAAPPTNVNAALGPDGMTLAWDASPVAPGFDPGGIPQIGFYQIELYRDSDWSMEYGSNGIASATHLIPYSDFGGFALGLPDGYDAGKNLLQLDDGTYAIDTISFSEPAAGSGSVGLECQIRSNAEQKHFDVTGGSVTLHP